MKNDELKHKLSIVDFKLSDELNSLKLIYSENKEDDCFDNDVYNKFFLFIFFRAIESIIQCIMEERKENSTSCKLYKLICDNNIKSYFINQELLNILLDELEFCSERILNITYIQIFESITQNGNFKFKNLRNVSDIKPANSNKEDSFNRSDFTRMYCDCKKNRNMLMHSFYGNINLTRDYIINTVTVFYILRNVLSNILFENAK